MVMVLDLLKLPPTGKHLQTICNSFYSQCLFSRLLAEFGQLLDLRDPDSLSHKEREEQRKEKEAVEFNPEHYLAGKSAFVVSITKYLLTDLHDGDPMIEEACRWQPDTFGEKFTAEQQEQVCRWVHSSFDLCHLLPSFLPCLRSTIW